MSEQISLARRLTAEAAGTAMLLATVVGSGIMGAELSPANDAIALLGNTVATGAILVVLILMFGSLSGAHFNPAVTLAFLIRKEITVAHSAAYVVVQIGAAVLGVVIAHAMFGQELLQTSSNVRAGLNLQFAEGVATFGLVATILLVLRSRPDAVPFAVGLYITAGYWFTASTSFANPAVTIARTLTDTFSGIQPPDAPGFIVAQIAGAVIATLFAAWLLRQSSPSAP